MARRARASTSGLALPRGASQSAANAAPITIRSLAGSSVTAATAARPSGRTCRTLTILVDVVFHGFGLRIALDLHAAACERATLVPLHGSAAERAHRDQSDQQGQSAEGSAELRLRTRNRAHPGTPAGRRRLENPGRPVPRAQGGGATRKR